jgi:hypothetical protein
MAANTSPIFTLLGSLQWAESIVTANNTVDLTSGTSYLVFQADATNGGYVRELRVKANPAASTVATVVRIWLNNGTGTAAAADSCLIGELGLPATTTSASAALPDFIYPLGFALPPGYRIYVTIGTAPGGSGEFSASVIGGKY